MASSWSIIINQLPNGALTFTPDIPDAHVDQPLGVNSNDNVTWNNRTNHEIALTQVYPENSSVIPFNSIPAGQVSNPIFNVTQTIGYSASIVLAKPRPSRKPPRDQPAVFWISVVAVKG
jgi:hypothetical protein